MQALSSFSAFCALERQEFLREGAFEILCLKLVSTRPLMLQKLVETAATAKQEELSSALLEKTALVEGLQTELQTSQAASQRLLVSTQMESHVSSCDVPFVLQIFPGGASHKCMRLCYRLQPMLSGLLTLDTDASLQATKSCCGFHRHKAARTSRSSARMCMQRGRT